jgi:hypothetical protein
MTRTLTRAFLVALLALACIYTYRLEVPETRSHSAGGITDISATTKNGRIAIAGTGDTAVNISIVRVAYGRNEEDARKAIANVVVTNSLVGSQLQLNAEMPGGNRNYGASFQVSSPPAVGLVLATTNGEVTATSMTSGVSATTTNGRIGLTDTRGAASLNTTNGAVEVAVHRGSVDAHTTNGTVDCDIAELRTSETVILQTTNGAVILLLPADVSATVDATTTNGTITINDFTVSYEIQETGHVRGRIGSGVSAINISTTNGNVIVRRRS